MQSKTTRRTFVKGLAAAGILGGMGMWRTPVWAVNSPGQPNVLTGNEFDLFIGETPVNITGAARTAMTINGSLPGPILRWREGDTVTLRVQPPQGGHLHPLARHHPAGEHGWRSGPELPWHRP